MDNIENLKCFIKTDGKVDYIDDETTVEQFSLDYCKKNSFKIKKLCPQYKQIISCKELLIDELGYILYIKDFDDLSIIFPKDREITKDQLETLMWLLNQEENTQVIYVQDEEKSVKEEPKVLTITT